MNNQLLKWRIANAFRFGSRWLNQLADKTDPIGLERCLARIESEFPRFYHQFGRDYLFKCLKEPRDRYRRHPITSWVSPEFQHLPFMDIERALAKDSGLFFSSQFDSIRSQTDLEGQVALLYELIPGSRLLNENVRDIAYRNNQEAGSDLIWKNQRENRTVLLEVVSVNYSEKERSRINQDVSQKSREVRKASKKAPGVYSYTVFHSPLGRSSTSDNVERIRKIKKSSNQVDDGDAGVLVVMWDLGLSRTFFEPVSFDRWYLHSGFIYHAFYGHHDGLLFESADALAEMLQYNSLEKYFTKKVKRKGRFVSSESKYGAVVFLDPAKRKGILLRNFNAKKPLTRFELITLVQAFHAGQEPSRWLDWHRPQAFTLDCIEKFDGADLRYK